MRLGRCFSDRMASFCMERSGGDCPKFRPVRNVEGSSHRHKK